MPGLPLPSGVLRNSMLRPRERSDPQQPSKGKQKEAKGEREEKESLGRQLGRQTAVRICKKKKTEKDGRDELGQKMEEK